MVSNSYRFDLSDRLIHFFRDIDTSSDSAPSMPEHFAFNNFVEGEKYPAFLLLRTAIRMHRLWATWSVRENVRTIYGPRPAVCFSEMPLAAFLESSRKRETEDRKMSSYGLTFNKVGLHDRGANPVIYGLTNRHAQMPNGKDGGQRLINEDLLPLEEQYRYVTYAPAPGVWIDWTHEREWRWPFAGDFDKIESERPAPRLVAGQILCSRPVKRGVQKVATQTCRSLLWLHVGQPARVTLLLPIR